MPFPSINAGGLECLSWLGLSLGLWREKEKNYWGEEKGGNNGGWRRGLRGRERGRDRTGQGFGTRKREELFS